MSDRELMKRVTIVLVFIVLFTAAFARLEEEYSHKFHATTGAAKWIWAHHRIGGNEPIAFFAARNFELPEKRYFTHLKIAGDPEYTIYINGRLIEGYRVRPEHQVIDLYDIAPYVKTGTNRIVVTLRSPNGMGGLLASIDIAPETRNWVITDENWRIYREWHPDLPRRDVAGLLQTNAMVLGYPPVGRWDYLPVERREIVEHQWTPLAPRESFSVRGVVPMITTLSGIAVASAHPMRATAYDFGPAQGRVRVLGDPHAISRVVRIRFASERSELEAVEWNLRPIVIAPGETSVTIPEEHHFRYVMLFGRYLRGVETLRRQ